MKFNANKDKTVDAIGPVNVMKAAARTVLEYPNFKFSLIDSKNKMKSGQTTGAKRDGIDKRIGIIEKKVQIPSLLVPEGAYKRGVMVSLPKGQHAFLKCADKKSPEKDKSKSKSNSVFVTDDKKKDPDPISMNALKPEEGKEGGEDENKKVVKYKSDGDGKKEDEEEKKEKEEKEKKEKEEREKKEKEEKEKKEREEKEKKEKEEREKKEQEEKARREEEMEKKKQEEKNKESENMTDEEKNADNKKGEKNSETEEESAFTSSLGNTEFELKLPETIDASSSEKIAEAKNTTTDADSGEKKHSTSAKGSSSVTKQSKPESFSQGYSDAKVFEKALTEENDKSGTDDLLKKQLLSLFDKDMMVSLYKMAIKDLMSELGLRTSKTESVVNLRGKINGLKKQQVQLEQNFPGITRSLGSYNKFLPEIQKYLDKLGDSETNKKSTINKMSKSMGSELRKIIAELKKRDKETDRSFYQENENSDGPSYDDCVDDNCRNEKQLIKTAHEYFGNLDALAMKPYEKFYKGEEPATNHVHKGIKRSSKNVIKSRHDNDDDNDGDGDGGSISLRDSLFKALTDASGVDNPEAIVQLAGKLPKVPVRITLNPRGPLAKLRRPIQIDLRPASENDGTPEIVARTSPGVSVSVPKGIYQEVDEHHGAISDAYADMKRSLVPRSNASNRHGISRKKMKPLHHWVKKGKLHIRRKQGRSSKHSQKIFLKKRHSNKTPFPIIKESTMSAGLNAPNEDSEFEASTREAGNEKSAIIDSKDPYTEIGMYFNDSIGNRL